jgi:chromosome partitioning protein
VAKVICVSNHKGGVGKTTIVANLGFALARYFKVLLIDLDPQANLSTGLGFGHIEENIVKYFKDIIHFRSSHVVPSVINQYVHIIPCNRDLLKIQDQLHETIRSEIVLKEILLQVHGRYDLILLDCPPSYNLLTINALNSSNLIIVPAKPESFSMNGIELIKNFAVENDISFKIVFNQVNKRLLLHQKIMESAKEKYNGDLATHTIRNTVLLAEAFDHAQNIFHYKSKSLAAFDFVNLSDELLPFI